MALASKNFSDLITFTSASGGGRFNASGQYEWLAANVPRIDYDPVTGECLGILVEEQRTNLLTYSSQFDNAAWYRNYTSIQADAIVAPDGSITAYKLVEDTSSNSHTVRQLKTGSNAKFTASMYVKAGERSYVGLEMSNLATESFVAVFNLATGAIAVPPNSGGTDFTNRTAAISPAGNGWYRISITADKAAVNTIITIYLYLYNGAAGRAYAGDGTSGAYVWGAQLESGSIPSSYIPTTSAQVTRAADVASVNTLSPWYNAAEGTLVAEFSSSSTAGTTPSSVCGFDDGSSNNRMYLHTLSGRAYQVVSVGGGVAVNSDLGAAATNKTLKIASAFKENDFSGSLAGATAVPDTNGAMPTVTKFNIGSRGSADFLNGHVKSIRYYPKRLTNAELQELTA